MAVVFNAIVTAHAEAQAKVAPPRQARCSYCQQVVASDPSLPFFEDRGEGSAKAEGTCLHCRCYPQAHEPSERWTPTGYPSVIGEPHAFEPHGSYEFDSYYCGCRGWE